MSSYLIVHLDGYVDDFATMFMTRMDNSNVMRKEQVHKVNSAHAVSSSLRDRHGVSPSSSKVDSCRRRGKDKGATGHINGFPKS